VNSYWGRPPDWMLNVTDHGLVVWRWGFTIILFVLGVIPFMVAWVWGKVRRGTQPTPD